MSYKTSLLNEIEDLRQLLYKTAAATNSYTSNEVVSLSTQLDQKLNELSGFLHHSRVKATKEAVR